MQSVLGCRKVDSCPNFLQLLNYNRGHDPPIPGILEIFQKKILSSSVRLEGRIGETLNHETSRTPRRPFLSFNEPPATLPKLPRPIFGTLLRLRLKQWLSIFRRHFYYGVLERFPSPSPSAAMRSLLVGCRACDPPAHMTLLTAILLFDWWPRLF